MFSPFDYNVCSLYGFHLSRGCSIRSLSEPKFSKQELQNFNYRRDGLTSSGNCQTLDEDMSLIYRASCVCLVMFS